MKVHCERIPRSLLHGASTVTQPINDRLDQPESIIERGIVPDGARP
jgi:hypothetical protein